MERLLIKGMGSKTSTFRQLTANDTSDQLLCIIYAKDQQRVEKGISMAREGVIYRLMPCSSNRLCRRTNYIGARVPNIVMLRNGIEPLIS